MDKTEFRTLREAVGLSRQDLGKIVGRSYDAVVGWEVKGTPVPKMAGACLICLFLEKANKAPVFLADVLSDEKRFMIKVRETGLYKRYFGMQV